MLKANHDESKSGSAPPQEQVQMPETDVDHGLTTDVAQSRLEQYGENALTEEKISPLKRLLDRKSVV